MDFLVINKILIILTNFIGLWLVFWVYFADRKKDLNRGFALLVVPNLLWIDFYNLAFWANNYYLSLLFTRLLYSSVSIFFIGFYYFFVIWFLGEKRWFVVLGRIIIIYEIAFSIISVFTSLVIKNIEFGRWGIIPIYSSGGGLVYHSVIVVLTLFIGGMLVTRYFEYSKEAQVKIKFFLIGVIVFSLGNLIFGVLLPFFFNVREYLNIANYSTIILLVLTAYAIVKQELMGIKTLLTQALIVAISIILLIDVFFLSDNPTMQLLKLGILLSFLYFSREMVASARKEKESREELEKINKHLEEKTQDLEALSYLNEMASSTLEIENSVQNIMDAVPDKLGHLGIMGTFLVRYSQDTKKAYAYIITQSERMRQARSLLAKPKLSDYSVIVDAKKPKGQGLIIKSILENKIEKGTNMADFISPPVDLHTARLMQRRLGANTFVSVPMVIRGKKKGALVFVFTKDISEIAARDLDLIRAFTQHVGVVRDNLHFYHHLNKNIEELTHTKDKLKEMLQMKNDFLHIVSHQLRTPLTAMRGFISMWGEGDFDSLPKSRMREIKDRIVNNSERLNNIVNDMVLAMESEGELKVEFKPVDLRQVLEGNIEMLKPNFEKKNLYLKYKETTKNIPKIEADGKLLLNVFMNLIDNAEKYTDKGGLDIMIGQEDDNIKIEFIDTGIGLGKNDKKILFKKFSRGAKSNYINPNGSGLGLFIIKQIIAMHHGKIKAASKGEGKGSTFTIILPIKQKNGR